LRGGEPFTEASLLRLLDAGADTLAPDPLALGGGQRFRSTWSALCGWYHDDPRTIV
jgi:hypothetical protein